MNRISIYESDATTNGTNLTSSDIVYVPGFAASGEAAYRTPKLCTSLQEFTKYFGKSPATFLETQYYPKLTSSTTGSTTSITGHGFSAQAIPSETDAWFSGAYVDNSTLQSVNGAVDPSYIYARELLIAGIPVVYERLNRVTEIPANVYEYTTGKAYAVNDVCIYNHVYYRCISVVTAAPEVLDTTNWVTDKGYKLFVSGSSYTVGDQVMVENSSAYEYYTCIQSVKSATAIEEGDNWEKKATTPDDIAPYDVHIDNFYASLFSTTTMHNSVTTYTIPDGYTPVYDISSEDDTSSNYDLLDKGQYSIKYFTSGGYPNFEYSTGTTNLANSMALFAKERGDAIAFIDHTDYAGRALIGTTSVYGSISNATSSDTRNWIVESASTFATMITPWVKVNLSTSYSGSSTCSMPGSFAYLTAFATSTRTYDSSLAIAGPVRGLIPNIVELDTVKTLTNSIANSYQCDPADTGISINPITYVSPYGYCIMGNRTLSQNAALSGFATTFLNQRCIICDVKKIVYKAAQACMFEQNNNTTWLKFSNAISTKLDAITSAAGISDYAIYKNTPSDKSKLSATIKIYPEYALESFDIYVNLSDEDVTVE